MRFNLFSKYSACYLLIVVSALLVLNTLGKTRIEDGMLTRKLANLRGEAEVIADSYIDGYYSRDMTEATLTDRLRLLDQSAGARILIVNPGGMVMADSRQPSSRVTRMKIPSWLLERDNYSGRETKDFFQEESIVVVYPIDIDFVLKGYVILVAPMEELKRMSSYHIDTLNLGVLSLSVVFFLVLLVLYQTSIVPLRALIKAAREYAGGNFSYKLDKGRKRQDEFNDLIEAFQFMAAELSQTEEYQRKFISNISHDFRSPLTSIKGFATAMMDGTIPPELYHKYLNTICFEADRLTKLTSGLIELGKFDSKAALLDRKDFDINQVIKQTAGSFEGSCREKFIKLSLIFENEAELVRADKGKIEQVLYNLLDNAIKFSHHNSEIKISTRQKGNKIFISVKDYGIGIPKGDLKKVWERFYKKDSSRGKDKKGSGLGLAIVKEIIQSHGEEINVVSTEGAGTEFVFTVSRAGE